MDEEDRWEVDKKLLNRAVKALFSNDFEECETLLKQGVDIDPSLYSHDPNYRDMRGSFALVYALVSLMRGIASFADDQLKECGE
eukprot:Awhi_evm1s4490